MQISRTHPERQRFALDQVALGRHPLARPLPGVDPPFDTLGHGEVLNRLGRTAGLLDRVADGLAATPPAGWPDPAKLAEMGHHLATVCTSCGSMRAALGGGEASAIGAQAAGGRDVQRPARKGPRAPLKADLAAGFVASVRGIAEKNLRDFPRLLREHPPTDRDLEALGARLPRLGSAAGRLAAVIKGHGRVAPLDATEPAEGRPGVADAAAEGRGQRVAAAPGGPDARPGTYVVVFHLDADLTGLRVGELGTFDLPTGYYAYVGSAFGPGGVKARVGRHLTPVKANLKWNVDYLTPHARAVEAWWTYDGVKRECTWSAALAASPGSDCPAHEFGARDCRKVPPQRIGAGLFRCVAHLYRSDRRPGVADFARRLGALAPGHAPVYRQRLDGPGPKAAPRPAP